MNTRTPIKAERNAWVFEQICAGREPKHLAPPLGLSATRVAQIFRNEFERRYPEDLKNLEVERITTLAEARLHTIPIGRLISHARTLQKEQAPCLEESTKSSSSAISAPTPSPE